MKLSISNIAWDAKNDQIVYDMMKKMNFVGLEIAPTKIFFNNPYDMCDAAKIWAAKLKMDYGFEISSMQSIWYGRNEKLFGTENERAMLVDYTKKAINFAQAISCKNLVFGCPRNRNMNEGADENIAINFFKEIGDFAAQFGIVIAMEANPPIYNTNYINDTVSALELIKKVDSKGFLLNLDIGTMIANGETISLLEGKENLINHVHISEVGLKTIEKRNLHRQLARMLKKCGYEKFVSIEVGKQDDLKTIENMMVYAKEIFS